MPCRADVLSTWGLNQWAFFYSAGSSFSLGDEEKIDVASERDKHSCHRDPERIVRAHEPKEYGRPALKCIAATWRTSF